MTDEKTSLGKLLKSKFLSSLLIGVSGCVMIAGLSGILGYSLYPIINKPARNESIRVEQKDERKPIFIGSISNVIINYSQDKPVNLGFGEIKANVMRLEAGGNKFSLYDYQDKSNLDWESADNKKLEARVERVVIEMPDGTYTFGVEKISDSVYGRREKLMLDRASEAYNFQLGNVRDSLRKSAESKMGPGPAVFSPIFKK